MVKKTGDRDTMNNAKLLPLREPVSAVYLCVLSARVTEAPTFSMMHEVQRFSLLRRSSCASLLIAASRLGLSLGRDPGSVAACNRGNRVSGRAFQCKTAHSLTLKQ